MIFVVLCSTMSFTIDMHYCGDTLVDTAIFHKVKNCGMETQKNAIEDCVVTKKNCCNDKQIVINGQEELQLQVDQVSFEQQLFLASFVYTYINLFKNVEKELVSYKIYKTPLVIRQIYKLDETYLI